MSRTSNFECIVYPRCDVDITVRAITQVLPRSYCCALDTLSGDTRVDETFISDDGAPFPELLTACEVC